jgi:hypothetical protein
MKKVLLVAVAMLFVATTVANALPAKGYIGLFVGPATNSPVQTAPQEPWDWTVFYVSGSYVQTYMWVWCLPSVNGMKAAEFMLQNGDPENISVMTTTQNPAITVALGDPWTGIAVTYSTCQTAWCWAYIFRLRNYSPDLPSEIDVVANPSSNKFQFASCATGYPKEEIKRLTYFYFNQEMPIGTQESSWGAIKSLF